MHQLPSHLPPSHGLEAPHGQRSPGQVLGGSLERRRALTHLGWGCPSRGSVRVWNTCWV